MFFTMWTPAEALVIERHARRAQSLGRGQTLTQGHPRGLPIARIWLLRSTIVVLVEPVLVVLVLVELVAHMGPKGSKTSTKKSKETADGDLSGLFS